MKWRNLTNGGKATASGTIISRFLSSENCFCFWARAFEISVAEILHDLDKNSMGSCGVFGWGIAGKDVTFCSSSSSSSSIRLCNEVVLQAEKYPLSIFPFFFSLLITSNVSSSHKQIYCEIFFFFFYLTKMLISFVGRLKYAFLENIKYL